jgi:DNA-binding transcriptional LysR family regulator
MEIDPRRLRVLHALAQRGTVVGAADVLHLTPSAVSQQLTHLEREVGVPLIDRSSRRRLVLTVAGLALAHRAERIEDELSAARRDLAALTGRVAGTVRIAAFHTAIVHLVIPMLDDLHAAHPEIEPTLIELEGPPALTELRAGRVDLVIAEAHPDRPKGRLGAVHLRDDPYVAVVPQSWTRVPRELSELRDASWIVPVEDDHTARLALEVLAAGAGFTPIVGHRYVMYPTVLALVAAGQGVALVPKMVLPHPGVARGAIPDVTARRIEAIHRTSRHGPEPIVSVVLDALLAVEAAKAG